MPVKSPLKISYGLRAFGIYFVILGSLIWFTLDNAIERLNDGMRQSAESVLVDLAHVIASFVEDQIIETQQGKTDADHLTDATTQLERVNQILTNRKFEAQIYRVTKTSVDSQVYITDAKGIIVYDSTGQNLGQDFSRWRDVRLTLEGKYGARTSFMDRRSTEPDDPKIMIVAAPIQLRGETLGVVSVVKPIASLEGHLLTESKQLQRYAFLLLGLALVLGYLLSLWFTRSLNKIATYANNMADGKQVQQPVLRDARLAELAQAVSHLRSQLDGKEYVENYIHSLTHELKTPITSIRGATELLREDMPEADRANFLQNIQNSNQRMSRLVDRMLSLAKLEGLTELVSTEAFDAIPTIQRLLRERETLLAEQDVRVELDTSAPFLCTGDRVLIGQAIANLLDNAIAFSHPSTALKITLSQHNNQYRIEIRNQGEPIPDFALPKLYDRFFSLPRPNPDRSASKSTGLGLSFVKEIMKLHHGEVQVLNVAGGVAAVLSW